MSDTPTFKEEYISQIPALQLLMQMGYEYLTPNEALILRGGKLHNVILTDVLDAQLRKLNKLRFKGQEHEFSDQNIRLAIQQLTEEPFDGLLRTNEKLYELLTFGTSLKQTIAGEIRSFSLKFIDWQHPEHNVYHVTDEFEVERTRSQKTRRPDIVIFVNGIPLVVIECKRPDLTSEEKEKSVNVGISQMIRNQRNAEIPHLFVFSQLLMSISRNDALFATTGTPLKFWSLWREQEAEKLEPEIRRLINKPLSLEEKKRLFSHRENGYFVRKYFDDLETAGERLNTVQDQLLYYLLQPARLLELAYQYIVFDGGLKKIARYQQYFAVKETIARVTNLNKQGERNGGVIWHTTGSGKSLTMVMLAKALALHPGITNPKIILVTDRVDLDEQIFGTFKACGKQVEQATSGRDLIRLVQSARSDIITTVIDKFETAAKEKVKDNNPNIFVLVDESHRSQYGVTHARMRQVFTQACYIGFTGTPLTKQEKSTAAKFGSFIHTYPIRQAVEDKAIVPLLYEGRLVDLEPNQASIDQWFERVTRDLTDDQKQDLKRKLSRQDEVNKAEQRIQQIAFDITDHFVSNFQGTGFKAQLAVPTKAIALQYKDYLDEFGLVTSQVVISGPDTREGNETLEESNLPKVHVFWKQMMERHGSEKAYNREAKASFARQDGVEILIVVDKLLTGFDEPRNTVLYLDKPLKEHGLLQAISRVNRLYEGKEFGYVVDYRGVLGELNETINTYDALAGFDIDDVQGTVTDVSAVVEQLPQLHSTLWGVFRPVSNKKDIEQLERFLEPEDIRQTFYQALREYAKALQVALATVQFYDQVPEEKINQYKVDLAFFHNLRNSVKQRYAEVVEYSAYEKKIRKLLDRHIAATEISVITQQVNVFDVEAFEAEVDRIEGDAAKADTIAYRMKRTISERMEEDPAFFKKFSVLIEETIEEYKQGRLQEAEYYKRVRGQYEDLTKGREDGIPSQLKHHKHAHAYYGILLESIDAPPDGQVDMDYLSADLAVRIEEIIEEKKIRDWVNNTDVHNRMKDDIEDYLYSIKGQYNLPLTWEVIDDILDQVIHTAKQRNNL